MSFAYFPTFDSCLMDEFEDLLLDEEALHVENDGDLLNDKDESELIPVLQADSLNLKDLLHEMEKRGLKARGFFADDAKLLQIQLDREHQDYIDSKKREKEDARKLEAEQKYIQRRKACTEIALVEEKEEVENNERISILFHLIEQGIAPSYCRAEVNNVSARTLSRLLWSDSSGVTSLDLTNLNLSDDSGVFFGRMLKNNRTLIKLELGDNNFGAKTFSEISEALCSNNVLQYLSLESNMVKTNERLKVAEALAKMIKQNKGLRYMSIWRCNIGKEGGQLISEAIRNNDDLTCFEIGFNYWQCSDIKLIQSVLLRNRDRQMIEAEEEKKIKEREKETQLETEAQEENSKQKERDIAWLDKQKVIRAEQRRQDMEHEKKKKEDDIETERRKMEECIKRVSQEKRPKKNKTKKKKKGNK
mmetsp:Transcript_15253/g.28713  ORF Transcript_15253/g.28713 Transcript_15253/m.28713 type:complete len:418 (-) Transcript_15253:120-1373(-)